MSSPEFPSVEQKVDKAINKIVTVINNRFEQYFEENYSDEDFETKEALIELYDNLRDKIKTVDKDKEKEIVKKLTTILEGNKLEWLNWTPRSSELVLHHAGYEQATVRYADEDA